MFILYEYSQRVPIPRIKRYYIIFFGLFQHIPVNIPAEIAEEKTVCGYSRYQSVKVYREHISSNPNRISGYMNVFRAIEG